MLIADAVAFWGPASEWVAGIGTLAAVIVALWTALDTERKRLKDKYASVFAWFERKNSTEYPVYKWDVIVAWDDPTRFDIHEKNRTLRDNDAGVRVDLTFQDALGRTHNNLAAWRRR